MENFYDDKAAEGVKKPVCDEVAMEDVAGTIIEEVAVRAAEKLESRILPSKGHEEVLLRDELIEDPKADSKAVSREYKTNERAKNPEKCLISHARQELVSGPPEMVPSSEIKKITKHPGSRHCIRNRMTRRRVGTQSRIDIIPQLWLLLQTPTCILTSVTLEPHPMLPRQWTVLSTRGLL